ncbi:MAG: fused MFS/spermidine synthase [Victivallales bacterium]|nr:fused MFS/spermidine synthase [Victivallales bacterium]MCF7888607.1 fused MFS/spermidine synthase [Victivallales bacterium]
MGKSRFLNKKFIISMLLLFFLLTFNVKAAGFWENLNSSLYSIVDFFTINLNNGKIIYEKQTPYFDINVIEDNEGRRHLVFLPVKGSQSVYDPAAPDKIFSNYIKYCLLSFPALKRKPEKILFIGLGGGIMPMIVRRMYPEANIDIVEIDGSLPDIAEKYFGFEPDSGMNIYITDGRVFVNKAEKNTYDIVVADVYNAYNIPFQFTTLEFYRQIKKLLKKGGICTVNIADMGKKDFVYSELKTVRKVFPQNFIFVCKGKTNYIPLLFNGQRIDYKKLLHRTTDFNKGKKSNVKLYKAVKNTIGKTEKRELEKKETMILTDDYAPVYRLTSGNT